MRVGGNIDVDLQSSTGIVTPDTERDNGYCRMLRQSVSGHHQHIHYREYRDVIV